MNPSLAYAVIGAGEVGPAIAFWLLKQPDTGRVIIADSDGERSRAAMWQIASRKDIVSGRCTRVEIDLNTPSHDRDLEQLFDSSRVVISAVPAHFSPKLTEVALRTRTHFCDLGGVTEISHLLRREFSGDALLTGVRIIHDCGLMPGLGNMQARTLIRRLDGADEVVIYVGGLPRHPSEDSFYWQRTFSGQGLLEILGPAPIVRNGEIVDAEPCSGGTTLAIRELGHRFPTRFGGTVHSRITAGAGVAPWLMRDLGVREFREETLRWDWDSFLTFIQGVSPKDRARAIEDRLPHTGPDHPDLVVMRVVARKGNVERSTTTIDTYDEELRMSAMARTTGFSAAAVARQVALTDSGIPFGVMAPEELPEPATDAVIDALAEELDVRFA